MKKELFTFMVLLLLTPISLLAQPETKQEQQKEAATQSITFESGTVRSLNEKASKAGKLLLVNCYADWSTPCKTLNENVFTNPEVCEFVNNNFISTMVNMEKEEGMLVTTRYRVNTYPTILILGKRGKELGRITGIYSASEFIDRIHDVLK